MKQCAMFLVLLGLAALLGCSSPTGNSPSPGSIRSAFEALPAGEAARGAQVFSAAGCHGCHMDKPVGPSFIGQPSLGSAAATRREGYSAELYLFESIIQPRAYIVQGYGADLMPQNFSKTLSAQDLADLVAYLMTFK